MENSRSVLTPILKGSEIQNPTEGNVKKKRFPLSVSSWRLNVSYGWNKTRSAL